MKKMPSDYDRVNSGTSLNSLRVTGGQRNYVRFDGVCRGYVVRERRARRGRWGWRWVGYLTDSVSRKGEGLFLAESVSTDRMAAARAVSYAYLTKLRNTK